MFSEFQTKKTFHLPVEYAGFAKIVLFTLYFFLLLQYLGVGNNHTLLYLSMFNEDMDKDFISGSSVWLQVCASDIRSLSCLSNA